MEFYNFSTCANSEGSNEATNPSDALNENFCSAWHNLSSAIAVCDFVRAAPIKQQKRAAQCFVLVQSRSQSRKLHAATWLLLQSLKQNRKIRHNFRKAGPFFSKGNCCGRNCNLSSSIIKTIALEACVLPDKKIKVIHFYTRRSPVSNFNEVKVVQITTL